MKKTRKQIEQEIATGLARPAKLYRTGRTGKAVVLPHAKTSPTCTKCHRFHSTAEHDLHANTRTITPAAAKKSPTKKTTSGRIPAAARTTTRRTAPNLRDTKASPSPVPAITTKPSGPLSDQDLALATLAAVHRTPDSGRFSPSRVFVADAYDELVKDPAVRGLSLERFKQRLVDLNREGMVHLSRADLVGAMNPAQVKRSEITHRSNMLNFSSDWHFIEDPARTDELGIVGPTSDETLARLIMESLPQIGSEGRFGERKVWISDLWDVIHREYNTSVKDLAAFKRRLIVLNRDGRIALARADSRGDMDDAKLERSEIKHPMGGELHFVIDPGKTY